MDYDRTAKSLERDFELVAEEPSSELSAARQVAAPRPDSSKPEGGKVDKLNILTPSKKSTPPRDEADQVRPVAFSTQKHTHYTEANAIE